MPSTEKVRRLRRRFEHSRSIFEIEMSGLWKVILNNHLRGLCSPLESRVKVVIGEDPLSGHLFVFHSRRGDRLKILIWEQDGFLLWYKRLEASVFKLPRMNEGARSVELRASWR